MFDIGWSEMLVLAVVAIVVVGPKELPKLMRTVGAWVTKARRLAREFQMSLDDMAREAELHEIKKSVDEFARQDIGGAIEKAIDPKGEIKRELSQSPAQSPVQSQGAAPPAPASPPPAPTGSDKV